MKKSLLIVFLPLLLAQSHAANSEWKSKKIKVTITAYGCCSKCCGKYADGRTATNRDASLPGVAVDPTVIPLGSRLDIPCYPAKGDKWGGNGSWIKADDTGRLIKGNKIDLRFKDHETAKNFGIKYNVEIRVWTRK